MFVTLYERFLCSTNAVASGYTLIDTSSGNGHCQLNRSSKCLVGNLVLRSPYHPGSIMKLGYARVSDGEDSLSLQIKALGAAGAEQIFQDVGVSGSMVLKPAYGDMIRQARAGDVIIVWRLDRLGRSLSSLVNELQLIAGLDVGFESLSEKIETATPAWRFFFPMIDSLARFERDVSEGRSNAVHQEARRVRKRGRPVSIGEEQWAHTKTLIGAPTNMSIAAAAKLLGVSRQAIYKRLDKERAEEDGMLAYGPPPPR